MLHDSHKEDKKIIYNQVDKAMNGLLKNDFIHCIQVLREAYQDTPKCIFMHCMPQFKSFKE